MEVVQPHCVASHHSPADTMKCLLIAALVGIATAFIDPTEWSSFKTRHGKSYSDANEELYRMQVYAETKAFVTRHNAEYAAGQQTFTVELNRFADLTSDEFNALYKGYTRRNGDQPSSHGSLGPRGVHKPSGQEAPESVD